MSNLIDMYEAGRILGVNYQTIRKYVEQGKLKKYKLGYKTVRVDRDEVEQLTKNSLEKTLTDSEKVVK